MSHTLVFVTTRLPHLTHDEFVRHYREVHAPLAQRLPGLVEYRQMPISQDVEWDGRPPAGDAVSVYEFESEDAADAAWVSPEGVEVNHDTKTFMNWESILAFPGVAFATFPPEHAES